MGGRDRDLGVAAGFDGVEDGLFGLQGPPCAVAGPAVAGVGPARAGQAYDVGMRDEHVGGRLHHLTNLSRSPGLVGRKDDRQDLYHLGSPPGGMGPLEPVDRLHQGQLQRRCHSHPGQRQLSSGGGAPAENLADPALHRLTRTATRRRPLEPDDIIRLAEAIGHRYQAMVWVGAVLGLRWAEVAGLTVGSLDLLRNSLTVTDQLGRDRQLGDPESDAGKRQLSIPEELSTLLAVNLAARNLTAADPKIAHESRTGGRRAMRPHRKDGA